MIAHLLAAELAAVADTLAVGNAELAKLNRYNAQTGAKRHTPALVIQAEPVRLYGGGRRGIVRVSLTVESVAGDDGKPAPDNHASRFALVHHLFVTEKTARIAEVANRGKVTIDDLGQVPGKLDAGTDSTGDKLRSVLVLMVAARAV